MSKHTFTTGTGKEFSILPGSPYQVENYRLSFVEQFVAENGPRPDLPTYTMQTAGGNSMTMPHDESTVETEEEKAAWAAYQDYGSRQDNFVNTKILDVLIVENVEADPMKDKGWLAKKKFFKVVLPADEVELKLYYIREHLIFNSEDGGDFNALPTAIMQLSGIGQRNLDAGRATFRRSLRRNRRQGIGSASDSADGGEMVYEPGISGDEDGEGVGADAEPVG